MNVPKNTNVQEHSYDNLVRLWGVRRKNPGRDNNNKKYSDMHYVD